MPPAPAERPPAARQAGRRSPVADEKQSKSARRGQKNDRAKWA
ncbi:hypothetical protein [Xenorhabdus nematophila]|nr:hypothetical protein [Xenorhabdus nematophila]